MYVKILGILKKNARIFVPSKGSHGLWCSESVSEVVDDFTVPQQSVHSFTFQVDGEDFKIISKCAIMHMRFSFCDLVN
jgi:hypothetical protein